MSKLNAIQITEEKINDKEVERQKAAALLDRPILQLEAMLAMRRAPPVSSWIGK